MINEIIGKIINWKHFIRLNVTIVFNKFRMHLKNEDFIIFITVLGIYKYRILFFGLTNAPNFFQQYITEVLFEYFDDFGQIYFDDILIYITVPEKNTKNMSKNW